MQLNVTTDYAIRIVLYLAIKKEITTSKEIGAAMGIPKNYVLKITHKLVEAGIIERLVGAQGGFSLAQKIDDITLLDILNIMEPTMRVTRFVFLSKTGNFFYAPLKNGALFLSLVKVRLVPVARLSDKRMQLQQKCLAGGTNMIV